MTDPRKLNVLFLCTGNSARSILGEALLNKLGGERFQAYSAGSTPRGEVHPMVLELLASHGIATSSLRSKSWDEFAVAHAPQMDLIFTVCDRAAAESCPVWPGSPVTAHWSIPDPAAIDSDLQKQRRAFTDTLHILERRIRLLLALSPERLEHQNLQQELNMIGRSGKE